MGLISFPFVCRDAGETLEMSIKSPDGTVVYFHNKYTSVQSNENVVFVWSFRNLNSTITEVNGCTTDNLKIKTNTNILTAAQWANAIINIESTSGIYYKTSVVDNSTVPGATATAATYITAATYTA
jgi:uncharacterized protein YndB with AHSA1/START domain